MPIMTLSIPEDLYKIIKSYNEIKWSEIARRAMWEYAMKLELIEKILSKSKLKEEDVEEIGHLIKKDLRKHYEK